MYLKTLGALRLEGSDLARYKPLLLLAYLSLEGRQPRRSVAELFWLGNKNPLSNLSVALSHLRNADPKLIDADDTHVSANVPCDALDLLASGDPLKVSALYTGAFLEGVFLSDWNAELEEWLYDRREHLAAFTRTSLLGFAETLAAQNQPREAARQAEVAYRLRGAPPPAPEALARFFALFARANHPYARKVQAEADDLDLSLSLTLESGAESGLGRAPGAQAQGVNPAPETAPALPRPTTPLIGRSAELEQLLKLMRQEGCRMVTITGLSGSGKTRLALELASRLEREGDFADGVFFVPLHGVRSFQEARRRGAKALGFPPVELELAEDRIATFVGTKELLILLDDVDYANDAAPALTTFLWACPNAKLLVTSEERLKLPGEQLFPIQGLSFTPAESQSPDAAVFFAERAARVRPDFALNAATLPPVLRICKLVEGSPLALELAAPWVKLLSLETIAGEIEANLDFLQQETRSSLDAYASISAAFEQSWARLDSAARDTLAALSLFSTPFSLDAARSLSGASPGGLLKLHDKSLLNVMSVGDFYLSTLLRRFLRTKLSDGSSYSAEFSDTVERKFVSYYADVLASAGTMITMQAHMGELLLRLEDDLPNIEQAWSFALAAGDSAFFASVHPAAVYFFDFAGRWQLGIDLLEQTATRLEPVQGHSELWGTLTGDLVRLYFRAGSPLSALELAQSALGKARSRGLGQIEAHLTLNLARVHTVLGNIGAAREAVARCQSLTPPGTLDFAVGIDVASAELALLHEDEPPEAPLAKGSGAEERADLRLFSMFYAARYAFRRQDLERAETLTRACLDMATELNYLSFSPFYQDTLALILYAKEAYSDAELHANEGYRTAQRIAAPLMILGTEATLARILIRTGKPGKAKSLLRKSLAVAWEKRVIPVVLKNVVSYAEQCITLGLGLETPAQALRLALKDPATMRFEHPLIRQRLTDLKGKVPDDLAKASLDALVPTLLEA